VVWNCEVAFRAVLAASLIYTPAPAARRPGQPAAGHPAAAMAAGDPHARRAAPAA